MIFVEKLYIFINIINWCECLNFIHIQFRLYSVMSTRFQNKLNTAVEAVKDVLKEVIHDVNEKATSQIVEELRSSMNNFLNIILQFIAFR